MKTNKEQFKTIQGQDAPVTVGIADVAVAAGVKTAYREEVYLLIENELNGDTVVTLNTEQAHKLAGTLHSYAARLEIENNN